MRSIGVFLLCALAAAMLSAVVGNNSSGPDECCFRHYPRRLSPKIFVSSFMTDVRCPLMGVILVTKNNNHVCANPTFSWVKKVLKSLDESML